MESMKGRAGVAAAPPPAAAIEEGISKVLSKWRALQMAVKNEWGGPDSINKSRKLSSDIFSWLFHSRALIQVEDLENLLHERLLLTFNTEIEDGSIEEMAEQLITIRDEYLHGNTTLAKY